MKRPISVRPNACRASPVGSDVNSRVMPALAAASATCGAKSPPGHRRDVDVGAEDLAQRSPGCASTRRAAAATSSGPCAADASTSGCRSTWPRRASSRMSLLGQEAARADVVRRDEEMPASARAARAASAARIALAPPSSKVITGRVGQVRSGWGRQGRDAIASRCAANAPA